MLAQRTEPPTAAAARSDFLALPGGRYHLRHWGDADAPLLLLLHGWMDTSGTFQFLVEALQHRWHVVAPDWLGYGHSEWRHRPYWLAELIIDLDALVEHLSPSQPVRIAGHSMGGNVASLWAGVRPERLERLALIESFGHPRPTAVEAHELLAGWLRDGREGSREVLHADREALARRLRQANPRLSAERAARIVGWLALDRDDGRVTLRVDPWHRNVLNHLVLQDEYFLAGWSRVTAPVLWVTAEDSHALRRVRAASGGEAGFVARMAHFGQLRRVSVTEAGHNVHHDQPEALAAALEAFLLEGPKP